MQIDTRLILLTASSFNRLPRSTQLGNHRLIEPKSTGLPQKSKPLPNYYKIASNSIEAC